jgi:Tfp pilus assembly protein PilF
MPRSIALLISLALVSGCADLPELSRSADAPGEMQAASGPLTASQSALACLEAARALETRGHDAEAVVQYERALQFDSKQPGTALRLAVLYDRLGDPSQAEKKYQQALRHDSDNADLLNDVGYFYHCQGKPEKAEPLLKKALAVNPLHRQAWANLGFVLVKRNKTKEAYEAFAKVVRPAQAHANVAVLLAREGRFREAHDSIIQALALEPRLEQAKMVLAHLEAAPDSAPPTILQVSSPPPGAEAPTPAGPLPPARWPLSVPETGGWRPWPQP